MAGLLRSLRGGSGALLAAMMMGFAAPMGQVEQVEMPGVTAGTGRKPSLFRAKGRPRDVRGMKRTRRGGWMMRQGVKKARNQKGRKLIFH